VDGLDAVEKAKSARPDVIILDIGMPKMSGLQAAPLIKNELRDSEILMLSQHDLIHARQLALNAGARAFVSKGNMDRDLVTAIGGLLGNDERSASSTRLSELTPLDSSPELPAGFEFLAGAGENGPIDPRTQLVTDAIGPIEHWPQILKTSVSLIRNSQHPDVGRMGT
jgi:DNA-binding NarL/FixJ family response regulator